MNLNPSLDHVSQPMHKAGHPIGHLLGEESLRRHLRILPVMGYQELGRALRGHVQDAEKLARRILRWDGSGHFGDQTPVDSWVFCR